jgi:hypothetical protein
MRSKSLIPAANLLKDASKTTLLFQPPSNTTMGNSPSRPSTTKGISQEIIDRMGKVIPERGYIWDADVGRFRRKKVAGIVRNREQLMALQEQYKKKRISGFQYRPLQS